MNYALILNWIAVLAMLVLPGTLLRRLSRRRLDPLIYTAESIGLGLAFWPALFLWTSVFGWHWTPATARTFALLIGAAGIVAFVAVPRRQWHQRCRLLRENATVLATFGAVLALSIVTRWLHIRELVLPNWVDSVHHMMLLRLILEGGAIPYDYAPFIAATTRPLYHWGYHVLIAWPAWVLGTTDPFQLADLMLQSGQILNVLMAPMFYAAGYTLFKNQRAGLLAATLGMLVSWLPAYYVSWGRYTHLAGILVLIPFCISLWRLHTVPTRGHWFTTVLLAAGLILIHIRVALFGLTFAVVLWVLLVARRAWHTLIRWTAAGIATVLATSPWFYTLASSRQFNRMLQLPTQERLEGWASYNEIPWHLVWIPHNHELLALATAGISGLAGWGDPAQWIRVASGIWLLSIVGLLVWRRRRGVAAPATDTQLWPAFGLLAGWVVLTAFLLNLSAFGLPPITIAHNSAGVITLFLPLCCAGAGLLAWAGGELLPDRFARGATAALVVLIGTWGAHSMTDIVNPATVLAEPADVQALHWIEENTPPDARFAVNVWLWQGRTYAGSDGGYWIEVLTDRDSILPPALYTTTAPADTVRHINAFLDAWNGTETVDEETYQRLRDAGVTHIYVGPRGGHLKPEMLRESPYLRLIYEDRGAYIFQLMDETR